MDHTLELAAQMQQRAFRVIEDANIVGIWTAIGATINLVGSLRMGLLINRRDVDFHIYTDPFRLADSFAAMSRLAENPRITRIQYLNLLEAEDRCIEWHACYQDQAGDSWQIDMIHILKDSRYAGYFERVADRIGAVLTPSTREAILRIKHAIAPEQKVMGLQIYRAVIAHGVRDIDAFHRWYAQHQEEGIVTWMP